MLTVIAASRDVAGTNAFNCFDFKNFIFNPYQMQLSIFFYNLYGPGVRGYWNSCGFRGGKAGRSSDIELSCRSTSAPGVLCFVMDWIAVVCVASVHD